MFADFISEERQRQQQLQSQREQQNKMELQREEQQILQSEELLRNQMVCVSSAAASYHCALFLFLAISVFGFCLSGLLLRSYSRFENC